MFDHALREIRRNPEPLSLILIDIDHFKPGQRRTRPPVGDRVLEIIAWRIADGLRDSDLIFRWGGEEFLVVLRDCAGRDALRIADKLREAVAVTPIEWPGPPVGEHQPRRRRTAGRRGHRPSDRACRPGTLRREKEGRNRACVAD